MIFNTHEDNDGNLVHTLDEEAIDYLIRGLEELRDCEPGTELVTPAAVDSEEGLSAMAWTVLRRVQDVDGS
jgi:hypothetical protein